MAIDRQVVVSNITIDGQITEVQRSDGQVRNNRTDSISREVLSKARTKALDRIRQPKKPVEPDDPGPSDPPRPPRPIDPSKPRKRLVEPTAEETS